MHRWHCGCGLIGASYRARKCGDVRLYSVNLRGGIFHLGESVFLQHRERRYLRPKSCKNALIHSGGRMGCWYRRRRVARTRSGRLGSARAGSAPLAAAPCLIDSRFLLCVLVWRLRDGPSARWTLPYAAPPTLFYPPTNSIQIDLKSAKVALALPLPNLPDQQLWYDSTLLDFVLRLCCSKIRMAWISCYQSVLFESIPKEKRKFRLISLSYTQSKQTRFMEFYTCVGCETKTGVVGIWVIFQGRPMFSHINGKLSTRPFE